MTLQNAAFVGVWNRFWSRSHVKDKECCGIQWCSKSHVLLSLIFTLTSSGL